ncbi:MAG: hypothetical protein AAF593_00145 [Planctomycetota bacterium]
MKHGPYRPSLIIGDDLEELEQTMSDEQRRKTLDWFHKTLMKTGTLETNVVVIGTILHYDSLLANLTREQPQPGKAGGWKGKIYRAVESFSENPGLWDRWEAVRFHLDEYQGDRGVEASQRFLEDHREAMLNGTRVLWAEREPYDKLMEIRVDEGRSSFQSEKQNEPLDPDECLFREERLTEQLEIILPDAMVLTDEFEGWAESRRRIDLLALDRDARLVVIELKRTTNDHQIDLQAIRYAAMASTMTFEQAVVAHAAFLARRGDGNTDTPHYADAQRAMLAFLEWDEPQEDRFGQDVRMILVAADFNKEVTTSVLWLAGQDLDISCIRLRPHRQGSRLILDVQRVIPLPEAEDYLIRAKDKTREARDAARDNAWRHGEGYWFVNVGEADDNHRSWEDCQRYGYLAVGSASDGSSALQRLQSGDRLFAYLNRYGYVGLGEVTSIAVRRSEFVVESEGQPLDDLSLERCPPQIKADDPQNKDWCVGVQWLAALPRDQALKAPFRRSAVCRVHDAQLTNQLLRGFGVND